MALHETIAALYTGATADAFGYDDPGSKASAAGAWCRAGQNDRALDCLQAAVEAGFDALERLRGLPEFAKLRGNERFEAFFAEKR